MSTIVWFFGRGASISCGITWEESEDWKKRDRQKRIQNIDQNLSLAMEKVVVDKNPYSQLLYLLEKNTRQNWRHFFITTNWDCLLQREINAQNWINCPQWLVDSNVFHFNGSIEKWGDYRYRTPIILPDDNQRNGEEKLEFRKAMQTISWADYFVIVGLSLQHKVDKRLIDLLRPHEDNLPFGQGKYLIVNRCLEDLNQIELIIGNNFPKAKVSKVQSDFKMFIEARCLGAEEVLICRNGKELLL